jgi:hypothetical protein
VVVAETFVVEIVKSALWWLARMTNGEWTMAAGSLLDSATDISPAARPLSETDPFTNTKCQTAGFVGSIGG